MTLEGQGHRCPQCGTYLEDDARFCPNCGAAVTEAVLPMQHHRWCPRCGEPVELDSLFCPACGSSLAQTPIEDQKTRVLRDVPSRAYMDAEEPDGLLVPPDVTGDAIYDTLGATAVAQEPMRPAPAPQPQYVPPYAPSPEPVGYHYDEAGAKGPSSMLFVVCGIICALCVAVLVAVLVVLPAQRRQAASGEAALAETTATQGQGQTGMTDGGGQSETGGDVSTTVMDGTSAEGTTQTTISTEPATDEGSPTVAQTTQTTQTETTDQTNPVPEPEPEPEPEPAGPPSFPDATASSTLKPDQITSYYGPYNAVDGDTLTAWNEGADGTGAGEWIRLTAATAQHVHGISLMGGYTKSEEIYYKNNRPRLVTVSLSDGYSRQVELADAFGVWQAIDFDAEHTTTYVQVTIDSVYEGTTWNDASFTEVSVY